MIVRSGIPLPAVSCGFKYSVGVTVVDMHCSAGLGDHLPGTWTGESQGKELV